MGRFIHENRACLDLLEMFLMEVSRNRILLELENADGNPEALAKVAKNLGLKGEDIERFFSKTVFKDDPEAQRIIRAFKPAVSSDAQLVKTEAPT